MIIIRRLFPLPAAAPLSFAPPQHQGKTEREEIDIHECVLFRFQLFWLFGLLVLVGLVAGHFVSETDRDVTLIV